MVVENIQIYIDYSQLFTQAVLYNKHSYQQMHNAIADPHILTHTCEVTAYIPN